MVLFKIPGTKVYIRRHRVGSLSRLGPRSTLITLTDSPITVVVPLPIEDLADALNVTIP